MRRSKKEKNLWHPGYPKLSVGKANMADKKYKDLYGNPDKRLKNIII